MEQFKGQPRLPKFAVPKRYDIRLKPDLTACKFGGSVAVDLDIVADTRFIVLNAAKLSVNAGSVSFTHQDSSKVFKPSKLEIFEEDGILVLEFGEKLPFGLGVLAIFFEGILNDNMKGFYRSTYEHNAEKKNMAVTQFEPVDARRCFPCWDEPAWKATFKITLADVPSELVTLSNMPVVEEKVDGHLKTVSYLESPIMSTYLVAIVVGLFDYVEDHTSDGVKVRVYCQVGKANQGKFALSVAVRTLELYKEYFAVPYSLPKLDMVAIPDFSAEAMENYGLVTYRDAALLFDEQHSAASNKQNVAVAVAHELAHQWFGNLVTMEWWTHLWLNEGFATWVSYLATDNLFPEWQIWTQFLDECTGGLRLDALEESHPIEVEINHADEVDEIFDDISYTKGAFLILMLQSYLGAECFQTQFLSSGSQGDGQWIVPITLCCGSYNVRKSFLLQTKSRTLDIKEFLDCSISETGSRGSNENNALCSWIKFNVDQTGFYRVKYDEELADKLRNAIENKYLSATDRFGVLDDSFALSMACQQSFASLLTLLGAYREELDFTVLSNLITISYKLARIAADAVPELLDLINQFLIGLLQYSAQKLGWDPKPGESHLDAMLRGEILAALAVFGHDLTINEASRRFHAFLDDRNTALLPADIRKAVYVAVMRRVSTSNRSGYESLLRVYRETDLSQEKNRILSSLASCPDPIITLEVLNFLLTSEVRSQDAIMGLHVSSKGRETAWTWLKDNWEHISNTWSSGFLMTCFVTAIVSPFASIEKVKEIDEFFKARPNPSITRTLKQSIERVRINAKWVQSVDSEKNLADVVKELVHRKY
ncbi:aminopeptidase M1-like isoform X2 [Prunus dulcis]|uniref:aminopeptidase M1-like isoform X2 n=1 Tax=Prunus dulcis TaxID=3755 RepID=UPI0014838CE7|nr:aminopeptidase M1-like isoform X2 [Prunus dulcis]